MADFPSLGLQQRTTQIQHQAQVQTQRLSQQQLMSVKMLSLSSADLRREIYDTAAKNPALIITKDAVAEGVQNARVSHSPYSDSSSSIKTSSGVSAAGQLASDNFQAALESSPDTTLTLCDHLEHQFLSVSHSPSEEKLGLALIHNLDSRGFHILDPYSLADRNDPLQTAELVDRTMDYIRQLDPVGTCCKNFEESLFVQAKADEKAPPAALFILDGHFDFLNPPQSAKILKKIKEYNQKNLTQIITKKSLDFTEDEITKAVDYIKTLDPFPARDFSPSENAYIAPDVFVEKNPETGEYRVRANDEVLPVIEISPEFYKLSLDRTRVTKSTEESEKKRSEHRFVMDSVRSASEFMESLEFRRKTLLSACAQIVSIQKDFFEKGYRYLKPLRQKEIAAILGVHEATISRMANEKYLRCSQGLFKISFFFTNAVADSASLQDVPSSKEGVMFELKQILEEHKNDKKALSDQKLSGLLAERGIKIARRTVAKYRAQLNIDSSYGR
jgi:RNA polymerase sigma-54 factor